MWPIKSEHPIPYKCPGIYCECAGENFFYDENDEAFSLFVIFLYNFKIAKNPDPVEKGTLKKR